MTVRDRVVAITSTLALVLMLPLAYSVARSEATREFGHPMGGLSLALLIVGPPSLALAAFAIPERNLRAGVWTGLGIIGLLVPVMAAGLIGIALEGGGRFFILNVAFSLPLVWLIAGGIPRGATPHPGRRWIVTGIVAVGMLAGALTPWLLGSGRCWRDLGPAGVVEVSKEEAATPSSVGGGCRHPVPSPLAGVAALAVWIGTAAGAVAIGRGARNSAPSSLVGAAS